MHGPVQQLGHDAVFRAEYGVHRLLGNVRFLRDGLDGCLGEAAFKEKPLCGFEDVDARLARLPFA